MSGLRKIVTAWRSAAGVRSFGVVSDGINGANGVNGWTPVLAPEQDGTRTLLKVMDWAGGSGTKPQAGMYLATTGYVAAKADAFNFNSAKRVMMLQATTNASGFATFNLAPYEFANIPSAVALPATTAVLSGPTRSTVSSVTKTAATVTVQQQAILTGLISLLAGATANLFVVEQ